MEPLMTIDEAGQMLGLKRTAMYDLFTSGHLKAITVGGGRLRRIRPQDLRDYIDRQAAAAAPDARATRSGSAA